MQLSKVLQMLSRRKDSQVRKGKGWRSSPFLTENLSLKLFSLALAVMLWGYVAARHRGVSSEIKFNSTLVFRNIPAGMEVSDASVQSVAVLVQAQRSQVNQINPNRFQVVIDLANQLPGTLQYSLGGRNILYDNQPPPLGMEVLQISPSSIPITLEEAVTKKVEIRPRFYGNMARGYTLERVEIIPPVVMIEGTRSRFKDLSFVYTRPLDVQDLNSNVEMLVTLDLAGAVRLAPQQKDFFEARIIVTQDVSRLLVRDIPVIVENAKYEYKMSTSTLNVFLEGPEEVVNTLSKVNVFAVMNLAKYPPGDYRGQAPKVVVPDTVKVLEQWPIIDLFVINRSARKSG